MAIIGIGTDVVSIARVNNVHERHGERFALRILSPSEMDEYKKLDHPVPFLAKRFAVKEACAKALGTGMRDGIEFNQISIGHDASGKPLLELFDKALAVAEERGINNLHVSISDERDFAVAFVLTES